MVVQRARNLFAHSAERVAPEVLELLREQAGATGAQVDSEQLAQSTSLLRRSVLSSLEEQPPGLGEPRGAARRAQAADLLAAGRGRWLC